MDTEGYGCRGDFYMPDATQQWRGDKTGRRRVDGQPSAVLIFIYGLSLKGGERGRYIQQEMAKTGASAQGFGRDGNEGERGSEMRENWSGN